MGLDSEAYDGAMRRARLAVAAHLDALAVVQDAKSLRLDYLRSLLLKQLPADSALRDSMMLRLPPEAEARLLLDMRNSVVMSGDGRSYQLQEDQNNGRELVMEGRSAEDLAQEILRREALAKVESARTPAVIMAKESGSAKTADGWAQAFYLFLTGAVFGATALAAIAIYLKKMTI